MSSRDGELIKDFEMVHENGITGIIMSEDWKFFFTSSAFGVLKQWNYEDNTLVGDHEKIIGFIGSLYL